jgi:hypothetical protein
VLLRVNKAAFKKESALTLISEFQACEHGCVIDSVASMHKTSHDNMYGTQTFQPTAGISIPLLSRAELMSFKIHAPSMDDLNKLRIVDITSNKRWTPMLHTTESALTTPFVADMNATTESISKSGAIATTAVPQDNDEYCDEAYTPLASNLKDCFLADIDIIVDAAAIQFTTVTGWLSTYVRDWFRGDMHGGFATLFNSMAHVPADHTTVTTMAMASFGDTDTNDGQDAMQDDHKTTVPFEYMTEMQDGLYRVQAKHQLDNVERV